MNNWTPPSPETPEETSARMQGANVDQIVRHGLDPRKWNQAMQLKLDILDLLGRMEADARSKLNTDTDSDTIYGGVSAIDTGRFVIRCRYARLYATTGPSGNYRVSWEKHGKVNRDVKKETVVRALIEVGRGRWLEALK